MGMVLIALAVAVVLLVAFKRSSTQTSTDEDEASPQPPQRNGGAVHTEPRHFVHRSSVILQLCSQVDDEVAAKAEHEELLSETALDVMLVLEDPTRPGGALVPVTDALAESAGIDAEQMKASLMATADQELAALRIEWTTRAPGFLMCESKDTRAPARLLRVDAFRRLPFPAERAIVMVPDVDTVLVADASNEVALEAMLTEAEARFTGKHWFSLTPFSLGDDGWEPRFHELPGQLGRRLLTASSRGVLTDFRDAMEGSAFPPARAVLSVESIHATWLPRTSVAIPPVDHGMLVVMGATTLREDDPMMCLTDTIASAFIQCVERESEGAFRVLDEALFPPLQMFEFFDTFDDAEVKHEECSQKQALAALKKKPGLVFPLEQPLVLFTDGRVLQVTDEEHDKQVLIAAMSDATLRAWSDRSLKAITRRTPTGAMLAQLLVQKRLADAGNDGVAVLKALEEVHSTVGLPDHHLASAVELALRSEDPELMRAWLRRGLESQPLNKSWRHALIALNVRTAAGELANAKPFAPSSIDEAGPRATLMPVLRPPGHAERSRATLRELAIKNGASADALVMQDAQRWPFARGIEIELVYDLGTTMQPLTMMDAAGSLAAELKDMALCNLTAASGGTLPERGGAWIPDWTDGFGASRLLIDWEDCDWMSDERTTDVIAFTPVYDGFLVAPANDEKALETALREAEQMVERADNAWRTLLTGLPWRFDAAKKVWVEHELPSSHPLAARVAALEQKIVARRSA